MQPRQGRAILALMLALTAATAAGQTPLGTAFTYQGRLSESGNPASGAYDFRFTLFDSLAGGNAVGAPVNTNGVVVASGLFTVPLDFGGAAFAGQARWLGVEVRAAGVGAFVPLSGRLPLTPSPHAVFGASAPWTGVLGKPAGFADNVDNDVLGGMTCANGQIAKWNGTAWTCAADADSGGDITGVTAGTGLTGGGLTGAVTLTVNTAVVQSRVTGTCPLGQSIRQIAANGTVVCQADTVGWGLTGNAGTNPGPNFIGTTDNRALELHVNAERALRLQPAGVSPNVIGGSAANAVLDSSAGAAIGGGGNATVRNEVTDSYGVVSGGEGNQAGDGGGGPATASHATVGGGLNNIASGIVATVAGGQSNTARGGGAVGGGYSNQALGLRSTVAGGFGNLADQAHATVAGGVANSATAIGASVGGGTNNGATGFTATVPGGSQNEAGGAYSFAAGFQAKIRNSTQSGDPNGDEGTFMWSDAQPALFESTAPNQFLVRAAGGVGINTNSPGAQPTLGSLVLDVNGRARLRGASGATVNSAGHWLSTYDGTTVIDRAFIGLNSDTFVGLYGVPGSTWSLLMDTTNGNVGIGGIPDPSFRLAVAGDAAKPGGGSWSSLSDARLKRDVQPLRGALDRLLSLQGVSFYFRDPATIHERAGLRIGMIAQDVEPVFPDWVETGADGFRRLTFRGFEALTVEALRELRAEKDAEIASLRDELANLRAQVAQLVGSSQSR